MTTTTLIEYEPEASVVPTATDAEHYIAVSGVTPEDAKAVTYTPPGPRDHTRYDRLVFHCEILALRLDGETVPEIDGDRDYSRKNVRADLRLPDGTEAKGVPYEDQVQRGEGDGSSWCRPFITSMSVR